MNTGNLRWRSVYRQRWLNCTDDELRGHIAAAQGVLDRLSDSDHDGYFVRLWHERLAELQAALQDPRRHIKHNASVGFSRGE